MGTLTLTLPDGRTGTLQVDNGFASMSEAQKNDFLDHVRGQLEPHASFSADLSGGLHDLGTAASQGANALGYTGVGKDIEGITPNAPAGPAPSEEMASNLRAGNYGAALGNLPHAIVRALPSTLPILAGGALGGPAGAGIAAGAEALGPTAAARAAANGTTPQQELLPSLPGAALQGVAGAFVPGGAAGKIANPLLRAGARAAIEGAAGAGMNLAGQAGDTAGTAQGLSIDPYQAAAAGLTQGGLGGARGARELASGGIKAGADRLMASRLQPPASTADAASVERVGQAMDQVRATAANNTGQALPDTVVANNVKDLYVDQLVGRARALLAANMIDKTDFNQLTNTIDAAQRHNNTITPIQLDHIQGLGLDEPNTTALTNGVRDLNTVSGQSFQNNETGPFRMLGNGIGKVASVGAAIASHDPTAIIGSLLMNKAEGKVGGAIGGAVDRLMGTNTPPVLLQRLNAQRMLRQAGLQPDAMATPQPPLPTRPGPAPNPMAATGSQQGPVNMTPQPATGMAPPAPAPAGPFGNANLRPTPATGFAPPMPATPGPFGNANLRPTPATGMAPPTPAPAGPFGNANLRPQPTVGMLPPDPVTGLPPSPIPVNTRIPSTFRPNTPQDVAEAIAQDDQVRKALPAALQTPQAAPTPTLPAAPPGAAQLPLGGALGYVARGLPTMSPDQVLQALQAHEQAGNLQPGTVARLQSAPSVTRDEGRRLQELAAIGLTPGANSGGNQGYAVEHSEQARTNARGYQMFAVEASRQAAASGQPDLASAILSVAHEKTIEGKQAIAQAFAATHPGKQIPPELLKQGKK